MSKHGAPTTAAAIGFGAGLFLACTRGKEYNDGNGASARNTHAAPDRSSYLTGARAMPQRTMVCSIQGCSNIARARGFCTVHYGRWYRNGDPLIVIDRNAPRSKEPFAEFFWSHVKQSAPDDCWVWQAGTGPKDGYGRIFRHPFTNWLAHRVAWTLTHGAIPDGLFVRHRCDNPPCCNPNHLLLGTHQDNMNDMLERGRSRFGERSHNAKVTDVEVAAIRLDRESGMLLSAIGAKYGLSESHVHGIVNFKERKRVA